MTATGAWVGGGRAVPSPSLSPPPWLTLTPQPGLSCPDTPLPGSPPRLLPPEARGACGLLCPSSWPSSQHWPLMVTTTDMSIAQQTGSSLGAGLISAVTPATVPGLGHGRCERRTEQTRAVPAHWGLSCVPPGTPDHPFGRELSQPPLGASSWPLAPCSASYGQGSHWPSPSQRRKEQLEWSHLKLNSQEKLFPDP